MNGSLTAKDAKGLNEDLGGRIV